MTKKALVPLTRKSCLLRIEFGGIPMPQWCCLLPRVHNYGVHVRSRYPPVFHQYFLCGEMPRIRERRKSLANGPSCSAGTAKGVPMTRILYSLAPRSPLFAGRFSLLKCSPGQEAIYGEA